MIIRETPDRPWQHVAADFKGPIIGNGRSYYFHVMIDLLSRWPEVVMVRSTEFQKLRGYLEDAFALHGVPESITSDNGPPYQSKNWEKFGKEMGFKPIKVSPEHPEGNGVAERFMATLVKTTHAAIAEGKDPKIEIKRRLLNYRNTPHPSTGKSPSDLMMNRPIRTRIPKFIAPTKSKALQEARQKDKETRLVRKEKLDKRKTAREKEVKVGDRVLLSQRKSTIKPPYDPKPYEVVEMKGTQVVAERGSKRRIRNLGKVKVLTERPEYLKLREHKTVNEGDRDDDEEDWLDMVNIRPRTEEVQEEIEEVIQEEQQQEENIRQEVEKPDSPVRRKSGRKKKKTRFLGFEEESSQTAQLSPRMRKKRQSFAKQRDKQLGWRGWTVKTPEGAWRKADIHEEGTLDKLTEKGADQA